MEQEHEEEMKMRKQRKKKEATPPPPPKTITVMAGKVRQNNSFLKGEACEKFNKIRIVYISDHTFFRKSQPYSMANSAWDG